MTIQYCYMIGAGGNPEKGRKLRRYGAIAFAEPIATDVPASLVNEMSKTGDSAPEHLYGLMNMRTDQNPHDFLLENLLPYEQGLCKKEVHRALNFAKYVLATLDTKRSLPRQQPSYRNVTAYSARLPVQCAAGSADFITDMYRFSQIPQGGDSRRNFCRPWKRLCLISFTWAGKRLKSAKPI